MKKRCTIAELLDLLEEVEEKRISDVALRKSLKRHGVPIGSDHKVDVASALEARKSAHHLDKTKVTADVIKSKKKGDVFATSYHEARIKQIEKQCEKIQIQIDQQLGKLVEKAQVEAEYLAELSSHRQVIENWREHNVAKLPDMHAQINELADELIDAIREREAQ